MSTTSDVINYTTSALALAATFSFLSFILKPKVPGKKKETVGLKENQTNLDLRRRHALIFGKATDHYGEVSVFSDPTFDLNATIFVTGLFYSPAILHYFMKLIN